ncbi:hypothetical protein B0T10DRAFT_450741 [Thelonectria olida]|uniref:Uncharacterized protein n=1 Tax=Thelonectria olida TaxID=1576542 RepID=A0A9P8VSN1_9HYPO|nr:hypothetical protein B0T10DRAFT_450741 [Thelonectria olida]
MPSSDDDSATPPPVPWILVASLFAVALIILLIPCWLCPLRSLDETAPVQTFEQLKAEIQGGEISSSSFLVW